MSCSWFVCFCLRLFLFYFTFYELIIILAGYNNNVKTKRNLIIFKIISNIFQVIMKKYHVLSSLAHWNKKPESSLLHYFSLPPPSIRWPPSDFYFHEKQTIAVIFPTSSLQNTMAERRVLINWIHQRRRKYPLLNEKKYAKAATEVGK